jgi:shikimate dehydrogenase
MPKLAVLGQPIAHSRSPAMHTAALGALGLAEEWTYEAIEVAPDDFDSRVRSMPGGGFVGANVTVPHKLRALAIADSASPAAREIGAANTLSFTERGIEADNTDASGLIAALPVSPGGKRALVLGAGGAARACVWALAGSGAEVSVWNRTRARAEALASELDASVADFGGRPLEPSTYDLLVNATSVGLASASASASEPGDPLPDLKTLCLDADSVEARHVVVDLVYGSAETPLSMFARERGATVVDGLEVLVHQGAASLRLWTGLDPPLDVMRATARSDTIRWQQTSAPDT